MYDQINDGYENQAAEDSGYAKTNVDLTKSYVDPTPTTETVVITEEESVEGADFIDALDLDGDGVEDEQVEDGDLEDEDEDDGEFPADESDTSPASTALAASILEA